jgi:hypothetical protein
VGADVIYIDWEAATGGDPYWDLVMLLVQHGEDGSTTQIDRSSFASTATINADGAFDTQQQVFGQNMQHNTHGGVDTDPFTSTGLSTRFSRVSGEPMTIECFLYYTTLANNSNTAAFFTWYADVDRVLQLDLFSSAGTLQFRIGLSPIVYGPNLAANTLHFAQLNINADDTFTLDLGSGGPGTATTEVLSGGFSIDEAAGGDFFFWVGAYPFPVAGASNYFVTPLRFTKGIARPRGTVPTEPWPTNA